MPRTPKDLVQVVALAAVYAIVGVVTLSMPESGLAFYRMVWLPSGIALGWMLLGGIRLWPGVLIGAGLVTALTGGSAIHVVGTAIANAGEAALGAWLLSRWRVTPRIESRVDLFWFLTALLVTTALSASLSVGSLVLDGAVSVSAAPGIGLMWWLTHTMGLVILTPLMLSVPAAAGPITKLPLPESILMSLGMAAALTITFTAWTPDQLRGAPLAFLIFPFLFWAAYRCGQFGASSASLAAAAFAVSGTLLGEGPFVRESANASLFLTLLFVSGVEFSTLFVAGLVGERERAERAREALERRLHRSEKLESLGALAGGIAHDFKNLLVAIAGNVDLVLMETEPEDPRYGPLQESAKGSARAAELCRQLLGYAAQGPFEHAVWDLEAIVGDMTDSLRETVDSRTEVDYQMTSEALPVRADPNQLRQVLINLFSNASDALAKGGGRIRVSTSLVADHSSFEGRGLFLLDPPPGPCAILQVEDDGEGIPADNLERIFQPVFSTRGAGRGIGLASALGIVLRHSGSIHIESMPGEGSAVTVLLPLGEPKDGEANPPPIRPL